MLTQPVGHDVRRLTPMARWWLWCAVLVLCIGGGGLRLWQNHQRRVAVLTWQAKARTHGPLCLRASERLYGLFRETSGEWPRERLEHQISDGRPFVLSPRGKGQATVWTDPASRQQFELEFDANGRWVTVNTLTYTPPPRPSPTSLDLATERVRSAIAGWNSGVGPVAWILCLVLCGVWRRYRPVLAELLLALALVTFTAWLVHPGYSLSLRGVTSNDMLFWGMVMLVISGAVLAGLLCRQYEADEVTTLCPNCRYDLTGNVSGVCPECGQVIPVLIRARVILREERTVNAQARTTDNGQPATDH